MGLIENSTEKDPKKSSRTSYAPRQQELDPKQSPPQKKKKKSHSWITNVAFTRQDSVSTILHVKIEMEQVVG